MKLFALIHHLLFFKLWAIVRRLLGLGVNLMIVMTTGRTYRINNVVGMTLGEVSSKGGFGEVETIYTDTYWQFKIRGHKAPLMFQSRTISGFYPC